MRRLKTFKCLVDDSCLIIISALNHKLLILWWFFFWISIFTWLLQFLLSQTASNSGKQRFFFMRGTKMNRDIFIRRRVVLHHVNRQITTFIFSSSAAAWSCFSNSFTFNLFLFLLFFVYKSCSFSWSPEAAVCFSLYYGVCLLSLWCLLVMKRWTFLLLFPSFFHISCLCFHFSILLTSSSLPDW